MLMQPIGNTGVRVLLLEGDAAEATRIEGALASYTRTSFNTVHCDNVDEMTHLLGSNTFHVALLDVELLGILGGAEAAAQTIQNQYPDLVIVMLVGGDLDIAEVRLQALCFGVQAVLSRKDLTESILGYTLEHAIERKQAEYIEMMLASIADTSDDSIIGKTLDGSIVTWNLGAERMYGYTASEAIGRHINILMPEEKQPEWENIQARIRSGKSVRNLNTVRKHKDGRSLFVSLSVSPVQLPGGQIAGAATIARDLAAERKLEDDLRRSNALLSAIVQGVEDGITAQDESGRLLYANGTAARILGFGTVEELLSTPGEELLRRYQVFDEDGHLVQDDRRPSRLALRGQEQFPRLLKIRNLETGMEYWSMTRSMPVLDSEGHVQMVINIFSDVTERKRAEDARRVSEELFAKAFRVSPAALWISDLVSGEAVDVNESFLRMTGYTREDVIGRTTLSIGLWADLEDRLKLVEMLRAEDYVHNLEFQFCKRSGEVRDGLISAGVVSIHGRQCLLVNCTDITDRKRSGEELARYAGRVTTLRQLDLAILQSHSPEAIAAEALEFLRQLVPYRRADVAIFDFEAHRARNLAVADANPDTKWNVGASISLEGLLIPASYREGQAHSVDNIEILDDPSVGEQIALQEGFRSYTSMPLTSQGALIGALTVWSDVQGAFTPIHLEIVSEVAHELAIGLQNARLLEEVQTGNIELQSLSRRLLDVQESERRLIARELHDEIGQVLTAVQLNMEALKQSPEGRALAGRVDESLDLIQHALQQVRNLSLDLRPSLLDDLGLVSALMWYVERQAERSGPDIKFFFDPPSKRLPSDVETACFRIAQEAMTNVLRHAGASNIWLELRTHKDGEGATQIELIVRDDGQGFDVRAARDKASKGESLGLLSMQERAELLGGKLVIESTPGHGSTVTAYLPLT